ncbi:MAG TPA: HlyD family type I secretion periplasmic adaptor subunit [Dongiaceae bacterium]
MRRNGASAAGQDHQALTKAGSNVLPMVRQQRLARRDTTLPTILEFQWPSMAIVNAPIPRSARGMAWIISSMVFVLIAGAGLIPVDEVVTTKGIVVSQSPTILVQPLETAIVRSIDVREGETVKAGEVLAQLDPTFATADAGALTAQVASIQAEVTRLQAEADGKPLDYNGSDPALKLQSSIYDMRQAERTTRLSNYDQKMASLEATIAHGEAEAQMFTQRLAVAQKIEGMRKDLAAKQYDTALNSLLATDTRLQVQNEATTARKDLKAMKAERNAFIQNWNAQVSESLADKTQGLRDAQENLNKASLRQKLVELRAERDAVVQSIAKVSVGSVLQSGQQFFTLVPVDGPLEIEANVLGQDNGFVHTGDPVSIKFDTFPYTQYGMAEGTVRIISPDSFTAQQEVRNPTSSLALPNSSDPYYRTRISIDKLGLHDVPTGFHLTPGMPVTTDIRVGKRTVLTYLLGRVMPLAKEGMREP